MATVRFSKELVDEITKNARLKMSPPVTKATENRPDGAWGQVIYDTLFGSLKPALQQLPDGWVKTAKEIKISRIGSIGCNLTFALSTRLPWPYEFKETELAKKSGYFGDELDLKDNIVWADFHTEVADYMGRIKAAQDRQTEFVEMVKKVCGAYSTLAPALKAWPPLWELIPEKYKDKHREITVRERREVELEVDVDKLTAMSAAARMGI
jgi:hypothetical protein